MLSICTTQGSDLQVTDPSNGRVSDDSIAVAVLAAGNSTRMCSSLPKSLHLVAGTPIVERVIRAGLAVDPVQLVAVVNAELTDLPARLGMDGQFDAIPQTHRYGTAGAVQSALDHLEPTRWIVALLGDSPLLDGDTVRRLVDGARKSGALVTVLTCVLPKGEGYGRIDRDDQDRPVSIIEAKVDPCPEKRELPTEINSGIMVLEAYWARQALTRLQVNPDSGELYLTDILALAIEDRGDGDTWPIATVKGERDVTLGINHRLDQARADGVIRNQVRERLMKKGVTFIGPETSFVDEAVQIGPDTIIYPHSVITGNTVIGDGCRVGPHAVLHNATLANHVEVRSSTITDSAVGESTRVGPYAHLRGNTQIGPNVHVGTAAEMKNSTIGDGSHVAHFSYLGDATVGEHTNIGAGTITANYDGTHKHRTTIGDNAFIGSDSVLIAPVEVGDRARTGAGAVVNRSVPAETTVVGVPAKPLVRATASSTAREE